MIDSHLPTQQQICSASTRKSGREQISEEITSDPVNVTQHIKCNNNNRFYFIFQHKSYEIGLGITVVFRSHGPPYWGAGDIVLQTV